MKIVIGIIAICTVVLLAACTPTPSPTPSPIPPSAACQTTACTGSEVCAIGGPDLVFGSVELGLAAAVTADQSLKPSIYSAYATLLYQFEQSGLTWGNVIADLTAQASVAAGQWQPIIQVLVTRISDYIVSGPVSACDQGFLIQHCQNILAFTSVSYRYGAPNQYGISLPSFRLNFTLPSFGIQLGP